MKNGFFTGLKYNSFTSVGSSIFPKLLGSYEMELFPVFQSFRKNNYQQIIDIGCAEGYYAIGLALQFPQAKVYAFDIDKRALQLCAELAVLNGVSKRVILDTECTPDTINRFNFSGRTLFICDCEGYERELFTAYNQNKFQYADLIIELHPFVAVDVKQYLTDIFAPSHICTFISSHDNNRKISEFPYALQGMSKLEQLISVEEGRQFTMDWLIAESIPGKI